MNGLIEADRPLGGGKVSIHPASDGFLPWQQTGIARMSE
jgi:hypothetical protein